ncbi:pyridoxamine 5'-phosphate oxidase family protein [Streptomyces sp. 6N223]|uniref:pyridoxamine 5'-phosphate oxidase family protein n=1 Tax=Streptomyces sp. 6N223 TaxID=3457412 RepID=UPI003FD650F9
MVDTAGRNGGSGARGPLPVRGNRPGSDGEHALQLRLGSEARADRFYDDQMLDHLNERMQEFVARQEWFFLGTSDRHGECDTSFRAGPPGFLRVLDEKSLIYPEYRGNGVHASLGNMAENPHAALLLMDFDRARVGLHINGRARIVPDTEMRALHPDLPVDPVPGRRAEVWVRVEVQEAYIHCAKHIPTLVKAGAREAGDWGTDDVRRKGGDFFGSALNAAQRREEREAREREAELEREASREETATAAATAVPGAGTAAAGAAAAARARAETASGAVPGAARPEADGGILPPADVAAWRAQARRALEEAERRGAGGGNGSSGSGSWFYR